IPYLARQNPNMQVLASVRGKEILQSASARETINAFSQISVDLLSNRKTMSGFDLNWRDDVPISTVQDGDEITVGKYKLLVMAVPGHSSCSLAVYEPSLKALFPSDAGGMPFADTCINSGNSNFTQYQEGLKRLAELKVNFYCADHCGFIHGEEAASFGKTAVASAQKMRADIENTYYRLKDITKTTEEITDKFYQAYPSYFLARSIMAGVIGQMVKHIVKGMTV
ncbi:MAG: hypothetical protein K9K75_06960, partial [Deltaproteobacteria bacterium]|nr:hypothetical protein [Deltaproteobacteria bacterium]